VLYCRFFLRRFRDPILVPRISNRVPRIRENYHRVPKIRENRVPRIREIGSLQIQTGFLTISLKKTCLTVCPYCTMMPGTAVLPDFSTTLRVFKATIARCSFLCFCLMRLTTKGKKTSLNISMLLRFGRFADWR